MNEDAKEVQPRIRQVIDLGLQSRQGRKVMGLDFHGRLWIGVVATSSDYGGSDYVDSVHWIPAKETFASPTTDCGQFEQSKWPRHAASMTIDHNPHKAAYISALDWIADDLDHGKQCLWRSEQAKAKSVESDEIWVMQWYPDTPIGFCAVAAPTFRELIEFAASQDDRIP